MREVYIITKKAESREDDRIESVWLTRGLADEELLRFREKQSTSEYSVNFFRVNVSSQDNN